jgi:hypothetical protein
VRALGEQQAYVSFHWSASLGQSWSPSIFFVGKLFAGKTLVRFEEKYKLGRRLYGEKRVLLPTS